MKRFFEKASKPFNLPAPLQNSGPAAATSTSNSHKEGTSKDSSTNTLNRGGAPGTTGVLPGRPPSTILPRKDVLPATLHPRPHTHLALLVTRDGLLIRSQTDLGITDSHPYGCVRVTWGKDSRVEEITVDANTGEDEWDWKDSVIVYGLVGTLELFSCQLNLLTYIEQCIETLNCLIVLALDRFVFIGYHCSDRNRKHRRSSPSCIWRQRGRGYTPC